MALEKIPKFDEVKEWAQDQGWITSEEAPVQSVDSKTGDVTLNYADQNHSDRHESGGADELDAAELSGGLGASGQVLSTNGSVADWVTPPGGDVDVEFTEITSSGDFTFDNQTFAFAIHMVGGGGGGNDATGNMAGGGGGGGFFGTFSVGMFGFENTVDVEIGEGGAFDGGDTTFGDLIVYGGEGRDDTEAYGGSSLIESTGLTHSPALLPELDNVNDIEYEEVRNSVYAGGTSSRSWFTAGSSVFGGGGGAHNEGGSGSFGTSVFAGDGGDGSNDFEAPGEDGEFPGGGGGFGSSQDTYTAGEGADGVVRIWEMIPE